MSAIRTTFAGQATFECNDGFRLVGNSERTCLANGQWTGNVPTCLGKLLTLSLTLLIFTDITHLQNSHFVDERSDCGDPGTPQNSERIRFDGEEEGDIAEYKCLRGFRQSGGTKRRMCRSTAQWYGTALVCESKLS